MIAVSTPRLARSLYAYRPRDVLLSKALRNGFRGQLPKCRAFNPLGRRNLASVTSPPDSSSTSERSEAGTVKKIRGTHLETFQCSIYSSSPETIVSGSPLLLRAVVPSVVGSMTLMVVEIA